MRRDPGAATFARAGFAREHWFPHDVLWVAKPYPDTHLQLEWRGVADATVTASRPVQLNVYSSALAGLPDELFTDRAVNWHGQQLGRRGLIAAAGVVVEPRGAFVTLLQSDLCQQVYRHPRLKARCKTRLDARFGGWPRVLVNAVLDFALAQGLDAVFSPTADQILSGIRKAVDPALFRKIYDDSVGRYDVTRVKLDRAEYWRIGVEQNAPRVVRLEHAPPDPSPAARRAICIVHDIEEDVDTAISPAECREHLAAMLEIEARQGIRGTYAVLGSLLQAKRAAIEAHGHVLAFHSFDHRIDALDQLPRVREVDLQIHGYRPAQSIMTAELTEERLSYFNFEWLVGAAHRFGFEDCRLERGIVKIPVHVDDWALQTGRQGYADWRRELRALLDRRPVVVLGLHDCYARHWLPDYPDLLAELQAAGDLVTCEDLADRAFLASDFA